MWILIVIKALMYPFSALALVIVKLYQILISPMFPSTCRFYPTCSNYMILAIKEWGVMKGSLLGFKRILRCRPKGKCGEDFVPENIKGDLKWIY